MAIVTSVLGLNLAAPLHAHRVEGLLQSSLVEVLPSQIGVEVTLVPGIDIAPKVVALLDTNGDGAFSATESAAWSALFMAGQRVTVGGQSLPLNLQSVRSSPLAEMAGGHAEIVVYFTAELGSVARGPRTIICANLYEPIPSAYQVNGLVPKAPGVRISSHRRDELQKEMTLAVEFSNPAAPANQTAQSATIIPRNRSGMPLLLLMAMSVVGAIVAAIVERRRRSDKAEL